MADELLRCVNNKKTKKTEKLTASSEIDSPVVETGHRGTHSSSSRSISAIWAPVVASAAMLSVSDQHSATNFS